MTYITIHTATYNRASLLTKAYFSLRAQTCKAFEWIITDDGSNDNTEELINDWQVVDNGFDIVYNKLTHVGFPRALNSGVCKARYSWFMMLDSDDYLLPQTVETIIHWLDEIKDDMGFVGIGATRRFPNGCYMKDLIPLIPENPGFIDASNSDRYRYNLDMECFEVNRTELLRKYPFQYWPTEEYAPPALNYNAMSLDGYKWRWRSANLYISDYLDDGLTKNTDKVRNNPMGYAMMYNQDLLRFPNLILRCKNTIQMIALCVYAKQLNYLRMSNALFLTFFLFPFGFVWGLRRKRQFAK